MSPTSVDNHFRRILQWSFVTLQALWRNIPNDDLSIVICLNLHPLCRESKYSGLDGVHSNSTRNTVPPEHLVGMSLGVSLRRASRIVFLYPLCEKCVENLQHLIEHGGVLLAFPYHPAFI